jgi:hypothetical protein
MLGSLAIFFAGLWPVSPLGKRYFVEAAIVVAVGMSVYHFALHLADERCRAQNIAATKVINKAVNKAVHHTQTRRAVRAPDPWDRKDY